MFLEGQNPTEDEIEDMIEDADEDGSGSINFPEFVGLMMKKQEGSITKEEIKQVCILFVKKTRLGEGQFFVGSEKGLLPEDLCNGQFRLSMRILFVALSSFQFSQ